MSARTAMAPVADNLPTTPSPPSSMPPPAVLAVVAPTPPRMTRLPSLKQLSDRLHADATNPPATTPPKLQVTTAVSSAQTTFSASPSSRLKLPASAMMRSRSLSGQGQLSSPISINSAVSPSTSTSTSASTFSATSGLTNHHPLPSPTREKAPLMMRGLSSDYIRGYKDVPSLDQLRQRHVTNEDSKENLVKNDTRAEKDEVKKDFEMKIERSNEIEPIIEDFISPKTRQGVQEDETNSPLVENKEVAVEETKIVEAPKIVKVPRVELNGPVGSATLPAAPVASSSKGHPLQHSWTLYYDSKTYKPDPSQAAKEGLLNEYELSLLTVGCFDTVEGFARHMNNIRQPSRLAKNANYHLFKNGIRPMWEDPANANGGKWVILFRSSPAILDACWANLTMALVGEILDPEDAVCGIVVSTRPKIDRIQVWTRERENAEALNRLGRRILDAMALEGRDADVMSMEFQYNSAGATANPPPNRFISVPFTSRSFSASHKPSPLSIPASAGLPAPPHSAEPMRRLGSGQGASAFSGPMGGMALSKMSTGK